MQKYPDKVRSLSAPQTICLSSLNAIVCKTSLNVIDCVCDISPGGYKEPGQDGAAGGSPPGPHGGGPGPAAGQQLHQGEG